MTTNLVEIEGIALVELFDKDGNLLSSEEIHNLVTDNGDEYYAKKAIVGIAPANAAAPTAATGMKLGTGVTAAAKTGAGAALGTYISGSNAAFDSSYPTTEDLGAGLGWNAVYRCTWAEGDSTNSAITEAVIVTDSSTDATSSEANTYARITFTAVNKTASDSLVITWKHKFLGA